MPRLRWHVAGLLLLAAAAAARSTWRQASQDRLDAGLIRAVKAADPAAVENLLRRGADPNAPDLPSPPTVWRMLLNALRGARARPAPAAPTLALALDPRGNPYVPDDGFRPVNERVVQELLAHGADPKTRDLHGDTALMLAAARCEEGLLSVLLQRGSAVNAAAPDGRTALMAADDDSVELRLLLRHGANVSARDSDGDTALHDVARYYGRDEAQPLVDAGAQIDARNRNGATPLMLAVEKRSVEMTAFLLARGADVSQRDNRGRTAVSYLCAWPGALYEYQATNSGKPDAATVATRRPLLRAAAAVHRRAKKADTTAD